MNRHALVCLLLCALLADPARAEAIERNAALRLGPVAVHGSEADRLQLGVGAFDLIDGDDRSAAAQGELRFGRKLFVIGPAIGLLANTDGAIFGYGGGYVDLSWGPVHITPMLAVGGYRQGDSKDMGGVFQFRQSIDLTYGFENGSRLGVRVAHISNAGINDDNPGTEDLSVIWSIPLDLFD